MTIISPSIVRFSKPLIECQNITNKLGCKSVHLDVCPKNSFTCFFHLEEINELDMQGFQSNITMHLFYSHSKLPNLSLFLRNQDYAILHVYPTTSSKEIESFLDISEYSGYKYGLSIDLRSKLTAIEKYIPKLNSLFIMGIPIGTCRMKLDNISIPRLKQAKQFINLINPLCRLGLDGGVNKKTFPRIVRIADEVVIGSLLTDKSNLSDQWIKLKSAVKKRLKQGD